MKCIRQICLTIVPSCLRNNDEKKYVHQSDKLQNKSPTDFGLKHQTRQFMCSLSRVICCEEKFYDRKTIQFVRFESVETPRRKTKN